MRTHHTPNTSLPRPLVVDLPKTKDSIIIIGGGGVGEQDWLGNSTYHYDGRNIVHIIINNTANCKVTVYACDCF